MTSNLIVPHIIYPTRITPHSKTLIDNIFSNSLNFSQGNSGNLTLSISDHLAQFLIIPMDFDFVPKKVNIFKRDTKNFDRENFIQDLSHINWPSIINLEEEDPNYSFNLFEYKINTIIDKYIPLKNFLKRVKKSNINHGLQMESENLLKEGENYIRNL